MEVFARQTALFDGVAAVGDRLAMLPVLYHLLWRQSLVADLIGEPLIDHRTYDAEALNPLRRQPSGIKEK